MSIREFDGETLFGLSSKLADRNPSNVVGQQSINQDRGWHSRVQTPCTGFGTRLAL